MILPRRTGRLVLFVALGIGVIAAAACTRPPSPEGWAAPRPITINGGAVLVAHKAKLYSLAGADANALQSVANWQFPPKDKSTFPISLQAQGALGSAIDELQSVDDATKARLKKLVAELMISGPSKSALVTEIKNSAAPQDQRDKLTSVVNATVSAESNYLNNLQGFYGDIALSSDETTAYLPSFRGILFALDTSNGHIRWMRDAGDGIVGGVAIDSGTLYFGTKGKHAYAVDATTGDRKWDAPTAGEVWATPTIDGDTVYVTSLDGSLYALDKASGSKKWVFQGAGSGIASRPVVSSDAVFVGAFDNKLYSVKKADGSENWSIKAENWFWATPLLADGTLYAPSLDGKVYAVDAATGTPTWKSPFNIGSPVRSMPVIAGGGLLVAAQNGKVYKIDPASGQASADSPVIAGTKILADLTVDGGDYVYVMPMSSVMYFIDAATTLSARGVPLPQ
jgi:outer membrane protein assembly factor BamB